jgi:spermidine/putrescine transport system ATP-binding protein
MSTSRGRIAARALAKRFGASVALAGVDLDVPAGAFATLLGPSGCGKTTLLRLIAGLERPDAGAIALDGEDITEAPPQARRVNTVFQSYALFPHLDVGGNVAFGLRARGRPEPEVARRVADALALLRIAELSQRRISTLSGGQRQRVALARALINEPDVLLLDEPMSALDAQLRAEVRLELKRLQRRLGTTFILVTHDQDEALMLADHLVVMDAGRIRQSGPPEEVFERPRDRFTAAFLGAANLIGATRDGERARTACGPLTLPLPEGWQGGDLAIRPGRVRVRADAPPVNGVRARVRERIFTGESVDLVCEPAELRARVRADQAPAVGAEVWLELPAQELRVLDG